MTTISLLLRSSWWWWIAVIVAARSAVSFAAAAGVHHDDDVADENNDDAMRTQPQQKARQRRPARRKNIVLFVTDDQDVTSDSIRPDVMPHLHELFREGGMEFPHYYVSTGLCCPSRATILRGQYCHNTGILDNGDLNNSTSKSGGWSKFLSTGLENENVATLLQEAGYSTGLVGKYMNGYDLNGKGKETTAGLHKPPGWDRWMGLLKCFAYYGPIFADNGERVLRTDKSVYQTDFIRDYAVEFLKNHTRRHPDVDVDGDDDDDDGDDKPFFLMVTPFAPHTPAKPAARHEHLFPDAGFPRSDAFDPPDEIQRQRPAWIKNLPKLEREQIDAMDEFYRNRLRSLQAVDEALAAIADALDDLGLADDTYFVYTADNGQHFGDHRIPAGKRQAYETDVLVPFLVRGPGIPKGSVSRQVVQSVDLGPTFLDIASGGGVFDGGDGDDESEHDDVTRQSRRLIESSYPMDGKSILPLLAPSTKTSTTTRSTSSSGSATANHLSDPSESTREPKSYNDFRWAALLEMYSGSSNIGHRYKHMKNFYINKLWPNTYQAVRIVDGPSERTRNQNLLYVEWCTGEQELYNVTVDPHQVHNLLAADTTAAATDDGDGSSEGHEPLLPLVRELSILVGKLGNCTGSGCHDLDGFDDFTRRAHPSSSSSSSSSFESIRAGIRDRLPCHNPPGMDPNGVDVAVAATGVGGNREIGRKPFARGLPVPEPFEDGFPFSDGDRVDGDLLRLWEDVYSRYFY